MSHAAHAELRGNRLLNDETGPTWCSEAGRTWCNILIHSVIASQILSPRKLCRIS